MKCEEGNKLDLKKALCNFSFQQQNNYHSYDGYHETRPPFNLHENSLINHWDAAETAMEIIAVKQPITDMVLCSYLKQRRIDKTISDKYCNEVTFKFTNKDAKHIGIGFKNGAGGYELRSEYFKLSSSPKYITYITKDEQNCDTKTDVVRTSFNTSDMLKNEYKNDGKNVPNQPAIVSQNIEAKAP